MPRAPRERYPWVVRSRSLSPLVVLPSLCLCTACDWLDGVEVEVEFTMHAERFDPSTGEFSPAPPPELARNLFDWIPMADGLLLIGGLDETGKFTTAVEHYDPSTQTWTRRAPWPDPGLAWSVWVDDRLCTLGGYDELDVAVRPAVWCYSPSADAWTEGAPLPRDYTSFYPTVHAGEIWIPGGTEIGDATVASPIDELWSYDPAADVWTQHASLPTPRGLAAVHALGDRLYVVGGWDEDSLLDSDDTPEESEMLVYEPATDTWTLAPQMPSPRGLYGSRVVGGELVVYFGITSGPLIEIFDPVANAWRAGADPIEPIDSGVYSSTLDGDRLYMLVLADGGSGGQSVSSGTLWSYDVGDDAWAVAGTRDPSRPDALFYGQPYAGSLHWVGAFTEFALIPEDPKQAANHVPAPRSPAARGVVLGRRD